MQSFYKYVCVRVFIVALILKRNTANVSYGHQSAFTFWFVQTQIRVKTFYKTDVNVLSQDNLCCVLELYTV